MPATNFKKKKLLLIGPCPPPFGGVSNHIKRLAALLKDDFDISFIDESKNRKTNIFNIRSFKPGAYFRLINKSDVIHVHSGHYIFRLAHFITSKMFGKNIICSVHSYAEKNKGFF
ncbi:MAG: glycosyltransferase [Ginsengibacter sp.]